MAVAVNQYDIGDLVRMAVTFKNDGGAIADPTTVTLSVMKPGDTVATTVAPVKDGIGVYHGDITIDRAGSWYYRWVGTGAVVAAEETRFYVRASAVV